MLNALEGGLLGCRYGDAPARVVALHGWRRTHADFDAILEGLDAVAPDLPGFGAAAPPPEVWGAAEYARAVASLLEQQVVVVGHSFGGKVAVMLAAARPERVKALVLTGVPLFNEQSPRRPSLAHRAARGLHKAGLISDERWERRGSEDYRAAQGVMRGVLVRSIAEVNDGTYREAIAKVCCPVEMVWGELDTAATVAMARVAQPMFRDARLTTLAGVGHMTTTDAAAEIRAAVERVL